MNKEFEKILDRLRNLKEHYGRLQFGFDDSCEIQKYVGMEQAIDLAIEIVQKVAEEFATDTNVGNNGWIPCSERLPDDDDICIVTVEYPNNETLVQYGWFDKKGVCWYVGMQEFRTSNVLAWKPLPKPYKESD